MCHFRHKALGIVLDSNLLCFQDNGFPRPLILFYFTIMIIFLIFIKKSFYFLNLTIEN